jgi:hypothetical protein
MVLYIINTVPHQGLHEGWLGMFLLGLAHSAGIGLFGRTGAVLDERNGDEVEYGTPSFFLIVEIPIDLFVIIMFGVLHRVCTCFKIYPMIVTFYFLLPINMY